MIIAIFLFIYFVRMKKQENFDINMVEPNDSDIKDDNIASFEKTREQCEDEECERIDKYRNNFFDFRNRLYNNSHQDDPVDNINISDKAQNYKLGTNISDIYDDLVNTKRYASDVDMRKINCNLKKLKI